MKIQRNLFLLGLGLGLGLGPGPGPGPGLYVHMTGVFYSRFLLKVHVINQTRNL